MNAGDCEAIPQRVQIVMRGQKRVFALDDPRIHQYKLHFSKRDGLPGAQTSLRRLRKADDYAGNDWCHRVGTGLLPR
jgi:hypothetical protein